MDVLGYLDIPALLSDLSCPPSVLDGLIFWIRIRLLVQLGLSQ